MESQDHGIIARILFNVLMYRQSPSNDYNLSYINYIESSLSQLKRAGLGLLSKGLGKLGLGSKVASKSSPPHIGSNNTIVIFVIGGVSIQEIGQLRNIMKTTDVNLRVIVGSNRIILPEDILREILSK